MAEELQKEGAVQSEKPKEAETTHEPSTNKVWDQSEHDRAVAEALRAEREKYSDYAEVKKSYQELLKQKEENDLKDATELEKAHHELTKVSQELDALKSANKTFELKELRNTVLSDAKYSGLPLAYKNLVELSDNKMDVEASAEKALEQFKADFEVTGKSFGKSKDPTPPPPKMEGNPRSADDLRSRLRAKIGNLVR